MKKGLRKKRTGLTGLVFTLSTMTFFLSSLTGTLGNVVDGFIMGQASSTVNLGAISLVSPLSFATSIIFYMLSMGFQPYCAKELSEGNRENARRGFSMALIAGVGLEILLTTLVLLLSNPITRLLGAVPEQPVFGPCREYMIGISIGLPANAAVAILTAGVNLEGARRQALYSTIGIALSNILMDLACVRYFNAAPFAMGLTTSISYYIGAGILALYFIRKKDALMRPVLCRIRFRLLGKMAYRGMPIGVSRFACFWRARVINGYLAAFATAACLAAYNMQVQVNYLTNAIFMGVAQTLSLMTVLYFPEQNRKALWHTVLIGLGTEVVISLLLRLFEVEDILILVKRVYLGNNTESYEIAGFVLILFINGLVGQSISILFANYLASTGRTLLSNIVYIVCDILLLPLLLAAFHRYIMVNGEMENMFVQDVDLLGNAFAALFWAQMLMLVLIPLIILFTSLAINRRYRSILWNALIVAAMTVASVLHHRSEELFLNMEDWLMHFGTTVLLLAVNVLICRRSIPPKNFLMILSADYGVPADRELEGFPETPEEVGSFSREVYDFCMRQNAGKRNAYITSLTVEEIGNNILRHGFANGKRVNKLEIRLVRKGEQLILRIQDNGILFDPTQYLADQSDQAHPEKGIGIQLIHGITSDIAYTSTLKLNNLTLFLDIPEILPAA